MTSEQEVTVFRTRSNRVPTLRMTYVRVGGGGGQTDRRDTVGKRSVIPGGVGPTKYNKTARVWISIIRGDGTIICRRRNAQRKKEMFGLPRAKRSAIVLWPRRAGPYLEQPRQSTRPIFGNRASGLPESPFTRAFSMTCRFFLTWICSWAGGSMKIFDTKKCNAIPKNNFGN